MESGRNSQERSQILRAYVSEPQNWNRYTYCLNDPVNLIDPMGLIWLTKDHENFQRVDDDKYSEEEWEGYDQVEPGTIAYFGEGWGGYQDKYKELVGSYVTLNADGTLSPAGVSPSDDPDERGSANSAAGEYTSYSLGYRVVSFGGIVDSNRQIYPTFGLGPSWANYSYSQTNGQGPVSPGLYVQGTAASYGLVVNESLNLLHPTSGLSTEVGVGTPNVGIGVQVILPPLEGTTPTDWRYHPDNPRREGLRWSSVGRCPF